MDEGEDVSIECSASSNPKPVSIVWTMEQDPHFRQNGHKLKLSRVRAASSGSYVCTVMNMIDPSGQEKKKRFGNATVEVVVRHKPGVSFVEPSHPVGVDGKSITMTCGSNPAGYPPPTYRWWKAGNPSNILSTGKQLVVQPVTLTSGGQYFCQPHNNLDPCGLS